MSEERSAAAIAWPVQLGLAGVPHVEPVARMPLGRGIDSLGKHKHSESVRRAAEI